MKQLIKLSASAGLEIYNIGICKSQHNVRDTRKKSIKSR